MAKAPHTRADLVGRDREVSELERTLEQLATGHGGMICVVGDAGMGKTALLEAVVEAATRRELSVLRGRAWPLDANLSYAPIVQALGRWLRELDDDRRTMLVEGLSELSRLFGELDLPRAPELGDPALEKTRLFEAVARLLERAQERQPILLCIDDLMFADSSSIELLHYLLRRLFDARFLVLCSLRSQAVDDAVGELLRHAELVGRGSTVSLGPLDADAQRALVAGLLGGERVSDELVRLVQQRSEGVPFLVNAIVKALLRDEKLVLVAGQWRLGAGAQSTLPTAARQLVLDVVRHLRTEQRRVLDHLAVAGAEVSFETLQAVCAMEHALLVDVLKSLLVQNLVVESSQRGSAALYAIAMPLAQEVLYEELSEVERCAAHGRFLSVSGREEADETMARHIVGAKQAVVDTDAAVRVVLAAAESARERYAHAQAAKWYEAALHLMRDSDPRLERAELLERLGDAQNDLGERDRAVEAWSEALSLRDGAAGLDAAAALRAKLSQGLWSVGRIDESRSVLRVGIEALESEGPSAALARLYGGSFANAWRMGDAEWVEIKATAMARWERSDDGVVFELALAEANLLLARGRLGEIEQTLEKARSCVRSLADRMRVGHFRFYAAIMAGRIDEACLAEYRELTRVASVPSLDIPYAFLLGVRMLYQGDLSPAVEHFEEAVFEVRLARSERALIGVSTFLATAQAFRGRFDEAAQIVESIRSSVEARSDDLHVSNIHKMALAALAIEQNDPGAARRAAESMSIAGDESPLEFWMGVEAWIIAGQLERAERRLEHAEERYREIAYALAGAERLHGLLALARGQRSRARESLERSLAMFEDTEMAFFTARVRLELAELEDAPSAAAVEKGRDALTVFERAEARVWQERTRALLRRHGERIRRAVNPKKDRPLSDRELEVARLAARGLTNAQIGRELFISPHTAATHMKRILSRAEVNNRPALGQWLRENGLADDD